ncbi:MAG: signal recognition particle protein [Clostridiales bacterium]|nr:signal recognition particle protein [Clostridiales bacterium]
MAFENLSERLQGAFKKLKGKGVLTEADVNEALREVRLALLEADVSLEVVKQFVGAVREKALGQEVLESLTPAQQIVKIVNEELTQIMGGQVSKLTYSPSGFTTILMAGLQGTGKTTTCGKLALHLKKEGKKPMMAACDVYRPAAVDQLKIVGEKIGVPVFTLPDCKEPEKIAAAARREAEIKGYNILIVDTSGRLHVDEDLMDEIVRIKDAVNPHEILLVVDSMTGQDAVNAAKSFNERLEINGIVMTKMDGDTRGGAALSVKQVTGKPIKFIGAGEKSEALEVFYPERMASRILGMGDMLSLIEQAEKTFDKEKVEKLEKKMKKSQALDLEDFLDQIQQVKRMDNWNNMLKMIPGVKQKDIDKVDMDNTNREMKRMEAIIQSMTPQERRNPEIINGSRRKRIADGCGLTVTDVNALLKRFDDTKKMMRQYGFGPKPGAKNKPPQPKMQNGKPVKKERHKKQKKKK